MPPADAAFLLLGPLELRVDGRDVPLTGRQRELLAALLLDANRVVSVDRLADSLWGERQPASPAPRIRALIAELRRAAGSAGLIVTRHPGYLLPLGPGQTDVQRFDETVLRAAHAAAAGDAGTALARYDAALALWRGEPFADLRDGPHAAAEAAALRERRRSAQEDRADVLMAQGRYEQVAAELSLALAEDPLRERLAALLMRSLQQGGRQVAALRVYSDFRARLADELGVEPSRELRRLHERLRADDRDPEQRHGQPAGSAGPAVVPRHLPRDVCGFVGRGPELTWLNGLRAGGIGVLVGAAGVGKSALATHWAHRVAALFPDGQLFVDMRGFAPGPAMPPAEALLRLLRALGCAADSVPADPEDQTALYRSLLAGRRVLILLDNVGTAADVRPLIPGEPGCLLLITSRHRLGGLVALDGASRLTVEPLGRQDAVALIAGRAGSGRIASERGAVDRLAGLCADLPLALCVAGAQLADRPQRRVADYVAELTRHGPLAGLRVDEESAVVRATLELSHAALPAEGRRMFRLLGLAPGAELSAAAAAALAGVGRPDADKALDDVTRVHLADETGDRRFRLHDLLRELAARLAAETDDPAERSAARHRLLDHYLFSILAAARTTGYRLLTVPGRPAVAGATPEWFPDTAAAAAWVDAEWDSWVAAMASAASDGPHDVAWQLLAAAQPFLVHRSPSESVRLALLGRDAARRAGGTAGMAVAESILGQMRWRMGSLRAAERTLRRAASLARRAGLPHVEARALSGVGSMLCHQGQMRGAVRWNRRAIGRYRDVDDHSGEAACRSNLASALLSLGRLDAADEVLGALLPSLTAREGDGVVVAYALVNQSLVRLEQGRLDDALGLLGRARAAARTATRADGARYAEAVAVEVIGRVHTDMGDYPAAIAAFAEALDGARAVEHGFCEIDALNGMAAALLRQDEITAAEARLAEALARDERAEHAEARAESLILLADAARRRDGHEAALAHASQALALAGEENRLAWGRAQHVLATVHLDGGAYDRCAEHSERALAFCRRSGQRVLRGRLLITLGLARHRQGNERGARSAWHAARAVLAPVPAPERQMVAVLLG